jgi:hypothetical protein
MKRSSVSRAISLGSKAIFIGLILPAFATAQEWKVERSSKDPAFFTVYVNATKIPNGTYIGGNPRVTVNFFDGMHQKLNEQPREFRLAPNIEKAYRSFHFPMPYSTAQSVEGVKLYGNLTVGGTLGQNIGSLFVGVKLPTPPSEFEIPKDVLKRLQKISNHQSPPVQKPQKNKKGPTATLRSSSERLRPRSGATG